MPSSLTEVETELRKKLSLLQDAAQVLLFAEPCLWDPN
jgi:hypothetical protein